MNIFCVALLLFQLFYMTSCSHNESSVKNIEKKKTYFRKEYRYVESRQSFYKFHTKQRNWRDARKRCIVEGASMWYPKDQNEHDLMVDYWKEIQPAVLKLHVGVTDLLSEGTWETVDGKPVEHIWHKWAPGEPNNAFGGENCAVIRRDFHTSGGTDLNDESCGFRQPFICKKTLASLDWNDICEVPDLAYKNGTGLGKCYKFHHRPKTWSEAHSTCMIEQSYLAVINSEEEKNFLVKLTADAKKTPGDVQFVHLGFHKRLDDEWQTVTGPRLDDSGWNVWGPKQPDGDNEQCGAMALDGLYSNVPCDQKAFFICEHDIGPLGFVG